MATLHADGFWYAPDEYLSQAKMDVNAKWIAQHMSTKYGWTMNAICGMLGNMETESKMNPGLWESRKDWEARGEDPLNNKHGYGLVQWTPWGKYTNYAERHGLERVHIASQLQRIQAELENDLQWIKTSKFPMTFREFSQSTESPYYLAGVFVRNYERPNITSETYKQRGSQADYYWQLIMGTPFDGSTPEEWATNAAYIKSAIEWAVGIANDDTHGYDQDERWGPDYDCASLVIQAFVEAGLDVRSLGATNTSNMRSAFVKAGFSQISYTDGMTLYPGDVLWRDGHCAMYIGDDQIVSAHINELGTITGGQTGDQTGHEIDVSDLTGSWTQVLRLPTNGVHVPPWGFGDAPHKKLSKLLLYAVGSDIV